MLTAAAIEDEGAAALRSHGRTFHVAHRLLGSRAARGVHLLYGFCRYVDDAVDEATPEEGARALAAIRADLTRGHSDVEALQGYMLFRERHGVD
ncbi:MAG: squalene/phytoene synthase family protein, partial [Planctomycetota bacterium]